jgi:hypothetical protein
MVRLATGRVVSCSVAAFAFAVAAAPLQSAWGQISDTFKYTGVGSCSASNCHGTTQPAQKSGDPDNTYTIWASKDKHSKAYESLSNKESVKIAKNLGIAKAEADKKCLTCHALDLKKEQLAPKAKYDIADGNQCEQCHGPGEKWLEGHDKSKEWPHEKSVKLGMYDTQDIRLRAEKCISCHLAIDHEMVAAGHPDLTFELDTFSAPSKNFQPHWKDKATWFGPRAWSTGQAVALRDALKQLATRASGDAPDKVVTESWRQALGYYSVLQHAASQIAPENLRALDQEMGTLASLSGKPRENRSKIAATASQAAKVAEKLGPQISAKEFSQQLTLTVMKNIASDSDRISGAGYRAAEQAALGLDRLYLAYAKAVKPAEAKAVKAAIGKLFDALPENPAKYDPKAFAAEMLNIQASLK